MNSGRRALVIGLVGGAAWPAAAQSAAADPWLPIRRLVGEWSGPTSGAAGDGVSTRRYGFVLDGRFLHEVTESVYPPQERNRQGERHRHWGLFSVDRARGLLVLRHFHVEGFVNTYRQSLAEAGPDRVVFESEAFENLPAGWRAKESYEFSGDDRVTEVFELAPPGKDPAVYSRTVLARLK